MAFARTFDAVNALDGWASLKQAENLFLSPSAYTLLKQQRTIEDLASQYRASVVDLAPTRRWPGSRWPVYPQKTSSGSKPRTKRGRLLADNACPECGTPMREKRGSLKFPVNGEDISVA